MGTDKMMVVMDDKIKSSLPRRIEVVYKAGIDSRGKVIADKINALMEEGTIKRGKIDSVDVIDAYSVDKDFSSSEIERIAEILHNQVTQEAVIGSAGMDSDHVIEIGFKPGVTDNVGNTVKSGIEAKLGITFDDGEGVHSSQVMLVRGEIDVDTIRQIGEVFANPLIQNIHCSSSKDGDNREPYIPKVTVDGVPGATVIPIRDMHDDELRAIAKKGILDPVTGVRRGPLALDVDDAEPMRVIMQYFKKEGRDPTDVELECLAQTWSEHCKHTIFAAAIDKGTEDSIPDGIFRSYIRKATEDIKNNWKSIGREDFLLSVFKDNSGIIQFDRDWAITDKVETHNSPSALDPFGGTTSRSETEGNVPTCRSNQRSR